jgi:hypothetical protein
VGVEGGGLVSWCAGGSRRGCGSRRRGAAVAEEGRGEHAYAGKLP